MTLIKKRQELIRILCLKFDNQIKAVHEHGDVNIAGRSFRKVTFKTSDSLVLPALISAPEKGNDWLVAVHRNGKKISL